MSGDCPAAAHHGNPFRYCPVKGCGWMEARPPKPAPDFDRDPEALAWARAKVERVIEKMRRFEVQSMNTDPEQWRQFGNMLPRSSSAVRDARQPRSIRACPNAWRCSTRPVPRPGTSSDVGALYVTCRGLPRLLVWRVSRSDAYRRRADARRSLPPLRGVLVAAG